MQTELKQTIAFTPSKQQAAYFDWIVNGSGSAILIAVAGSGKTTSLIEGLSYMKGQIFFGVYSKAIELELKARVPTRDGLTVSTMHAAGLRAWSNANRGVKIEKNKCRDIFRQASGKHPQYVPFEDAVLALVSFAKNHAFNVGGETPKAEWNGLIDHYTIDCLGEDDLVINLARKVLGASNSSAHEIIDFDDMIYCPLYFKSYFYKYDWVLLDEAQDTNISRRLLALAMLKPTGRLIAVGDPHQAIFGFTGADANSLEMIKQATGACDLPLTVSYRCPTAIVEYAQRFVSHIQAAPNAKAGTVRSIELKLLSSDAKIGDVILCRFNAPLLTQAFSFLAKGIPVRVEGREIGEGLKKLAKRWKSKDFDALIQNLENYREREVAKAVAKEQTNKVTQIEDTVECLFVVINRVQSKGEQAGMPGDLVSAEIDSIFGGDEKKPVVLMSSIHRAKGREWMNVYWLQTGPSKRATKEWEHVQENNLMYVAVTRAKDSLILVDME